MKRKLLLIFLSLIIVSMALNSFYVFTVKAENNKENRNSKIDIAQDCFYRGDFNNALKMYEDIIKDYPDNSNFRLALAKIYIEKTNFQKAREHLSKAVEIGPNNAEAHYYLASIHSLMGNYKQAIDECKRALEINPQFYVARLLLADAYMYEFDDVRSEEELKKLLMVTPESLSVHWRLGQLYGGLQGNLDKSIVEMEKAVGLKSDVSKLCGELGGLYLRSFNLQKAVESFRKSVEINPQNIESHHGLGQAYQYLGYLDEALQHYRIVLEKQPQNLWLLQSLTGIYYQKGNYEKLKEICLKGIEFYPKNPDLHFLLGVAYYNFMKGIEYVEKAREQFETTLQLKPNYPQAKEWLEMTAKLLKDNKLITDNLIYTGETRHYIIKTDLSEVVVNRLVQEGRAEQIFEDAKIFFSKLLKKEIEASPLKVMIFKERKDFTKYFQSKCSCDVGAVGSSITYINEIIIDGGERFRIEHILLHETAHAMLRKNVPNIPGWLEEALSGGLPFSKYWGIKSKYLNELIASDKFAKLNEKTIMEEEQDPLIYYLFGNFLFTNYYTNLEEYLRMLQEGKKAEEVFFIVFRSKQGTLGSEFKQFIKDMANKLSAIDSIVDFELETVSYNLGHNHIKPEDILLNMLADWRQSIARVVLLENNVTAEGLKSFIKKGNKPYYGNLSQEAERLLLLASEQIRGKKKYSITIDEYLLTLLEDNENEVVSLLKYMGVDTQVLYRHLSEALEKFKDGEVRLFLLMPKSILSGTTISLFYWLFPDDKDVEVFLNNTKLSKLFVSEKESYKKSGLLYYPLAIPDTLKLGPCNLEIKQNDEIIQTLPFMVTDQLPVPLIEDINVAPYSEGGGLFKNISRLKFRVAFWDKKLIPLFSFKQNDKTFFANGSINESYTTDALVVDMPHEVQVGEVEITLQAEFDKRQGLPSYPVLLKVFEQKLPHIISLNKYTFTPGEKILIKGKNFAWGDNVNEAIIGSFVVRASLHKKEDLDSVEDLLSEFGGYSAQTLEVGIPNDKGLHGKIPIKVKVYDKVSNKVYLELQDILKK